MILASPTYKTPKEIPPIFNSIVKATCQETNPEYFFPQRWNILSVLAKYLSTGVQKNEGPKLGATNVLLN